MRRARLVAVLAGEPAAGSTLAPAALADEVFALGDIAPGRLDELGVSSAILWLPAWSRLDERFAAVLDAWRTTPAGPLVARPLLRCGEGWLRLPERILAAPPGAGVPRDGRLAARTRAPRPRAVDGLPVIEPPALSPHLRAVDEQSGALARLACAAGERPSSRALALRPLRVVATALLAARGDRRAVLPCAAVEAYRDVLVQVKLWEMLVVEPGFPA